MSHNHDNHIVQEVTKLYTEVELFGDGVKARELSDIIKQHALAGLGIAMIPIPGADLAALAVNTWTMYVRINKVVGVSFGDNVLKSIVSGVIANIISTLPALGLGLVAQGIFKIVPGIGTLGGAALGAVVNVGVMYAAGKVYLKALEKLLNSGEPLTADNLGEEARRVSKEKSFVKEVYNEGKEIGKKNR